MVANESEVLPTAAALDPDDGDPSAFEVNPYRHNQIGINILKHVLDNRWGAVVDTIVCTSTLLVANLQVAIKGWKNHDNG